MGEGWGRGTTTKQQPMKAHLIRNNVFVTLSGGRCVCVYVLYVRHFLWNCETYWKGAGLLGASP